jgi:DNA-binding beta-propeller fold protein YncE
MESHPTRHLVIIATIFIANVILSANDTTPILPQLSPVPTFTVSTVPANGDLNPYGVAFVPPGFPAGGLLNPGDVLVSNFNASSNVQGTGTTIVRIDPIGNQSLFFHGSGNVGLTTALGVLSGGFVIVGSVPTNRPSGTCTQEPSGVQTGVGEGELLILDKHAHVVTSLHSHQFLNGPWDLTVRDQGTAAQVYVSNVRDATVTRLDLAISPNNNQVTVVRMTQIASGYVRRCDPAALVIGPTGVAVDPANDVLYVASTGDNTIYAVAHASVATTDHGTGSSFVHDPTHMHGPLGLIRTPNGDLIAAQGDAVNPDPAHPSELVEYNSGGQFVAQMSVDPAPGSAFGLALEPLANNAFEFAAVNDDLNALEIWKVQ